MQALFENYPEGILEGTLPESIYEIIDAAWELTANRSKTGKYIIERGAAAGPLSEREYQNPAKVFLAFFNHGLPDEWKELLGDKQALKEEKTMALLHKMLAAAWLIGERESALI